MRDLVLMGCGFVFAYTVDYLFWLRLMRKERTRQLHQLEEL